MGPFLQNNPWAQQSFNQAMSCLQAGQQLEQMGNLVAAGPYYQQALYALAACTQMLGPLTPDVVYYWMGCCQVRIGFLTHAAGNLNWAQDWFRQALGSAQAACQRNPANPWYQLAVTQLALALGDVALARTHYHHLSGQHPALAQVLRGVPQLNRPAAQAGGSAEGSPGKLKVWLEVDGKAVDILSSLIKMVGGMSGDHGLPAMPGSADMGMGWLGGMGGVNAGGFGGLFGGT